jgi:hypothetical protein
MAEKLGAQTVVDQMAGDNEDEVGDGDGREDGDDHHRHLGLRRLDVFGRLFRQVDPDSWSGFDEFLSAVIADFTSNINW